MCRLEKGISPHVDLVETLLEMDDTQENSQMDYDEYEFQKKEKEKKAKIILVTIKMEKNKKNEEIDNRIKQLIS